MNGKCVIFHQFGSPNEVLRVESKFITPPKDNEVLVRMLTRPINPSDLIPIRGAYAHRISLPNIPGYEGVGIVEAVGPFVSQELIGKRVLPLRGEGTWQEFVKTTSDFAILIPDSIDDVVAAQLYINPLTAWVICTEVLKLEPNDVLLINAAGSSVGQIFVQLSKILGFRVIAVVRNNHYTERLRTLGASAVVDISQASLHKSVMELTNGEGAAAAIDSIGGNSGNELAFCVHPNGHFLSIGLLSGVQVNWSEIVQKAKVNANMFHLRNWNEYASLNKWHDTFQNVIKLVVEKNLNLKRVHESYRLTEIKKAIETVESAKGKVMLTN
ncbi:zinc-dependent alcohol dehydrogenase family protein [Robertmurraya sp. DFI.2.37]|uniref:zinc-dependent alcohol dehydrogenase family protein n=1 Tax=Robertmurraya sp. DFI.2.37 TaxID=3031819 RepID=UPI001CD93D9E|nr:zinc-dependent alcohol dehydrogenase family protein [Robertmurraya sp. DFI.2.37]